MTDGAPHRDGWLVIIDAQAIFADPASPWGSPMWPTAMAGIAALASDFGPERTIATRFVADAGLGGSWTPYYRDWPFALVPDADPLYGLVPGIEELAGAVITEPTFGKWSPRLRAVTGEQPALTLAGVATDCCVLATALPAADAGATVRVAAKACAGSTTENHERALSAMDLFGPQIIIDR